MAKLLISADDGTERSVELNDTLVRIGRGQGNDIVLPDGSKGVSRAHAELRFENGRYVIVDLQSQNGTWLNGQRVERADVPFGSEIAIGVYRLRLQGSVAATAAQAPARPWADITISRSPELPAVPARRYPAAGSKGLMLAIAAVVAAAGWLAWAWTRTGDAGPSSADAGLADRPTSAPATEPDIARTGAGVPGESPDRSADGGATNAGEPGTGSASTGSQRAKPPAAASAPAWASPDVPAGIRPNTPPVARRPNETVEAWRRRVAALQTRYEYSKAALDRSDFTAAAGGFEAILRDEPGFLDAAQLLVQARAGIRASARALFDAGTRLHEDGDWLGALQKYEQARQVDPDLPGIGAAIARAQRDVRSAGAAAFRRARELDASGRVEDALLEYDKAARWLPAGDPNRETARARAAELR